MSSSSSSSSSNSSSAGTTPPMSSSASTTPLSSSTAPTSSSPAQSSPPTTTPQQQPSTTPPSSSSSTTPAPSPTTTPQQQQPSPSSSQRPSQAQTTPAQSTPAASSSRSSSQSTTPGRSSQAPAQTSSSPAEVVPTSPDAVAETSPLSLSTSTSEYTLTTSGRVVVVTSLVTNVVSGNPSQTSGVGGRNLNGTPSSRNNSFFSNTGAVAGTFVVVGLVAAGLLAGLAYFFFRRKKRRQLDEDLRVAAGGAGAGGAGIARFDDDDDDLEDPFNPPSGSDAAFVSPSPRMSQYNSNPASISAFGAGAISGHERRASGALSNHRMSYSSDPYSPPLSNQSHLPYMTNGSGSATAAPAPGVFGGYTYSSNPQLASNTARSHEGALYDDWAEYVHSSGANNNINNNNGGATLGYGALDHHTGGAAADRSAEGAIGSASTSIEMDRTPSTPSAYSGATTPSLPAVAQMPVLLPDDRLDPAKLAAAHLEHENESQVSLKDDHDYSRPILRVANPEDR